MKKIASFAVIAAILVTNPYVAVGQSQGEKSALGVEGKTAHTDLVAGLKQFPAKYPTSRGLVRATIYGHSIGTPVTENGKVYESQFLMLTTEDGQNLNIQVVGPEVELALLMYEMRPHTGKYKFWYPVLEFQGRYNDYVYDWYEIEVVGRFLVEINKDSKIIGYKNEVYR